MSEILSSFSLKAFTDSVTLPVHEPISFGFDEIVKAKAEADAAVTAEIERRLTELELGISDRFERLLYRTSETGTAETKYIYNYDLVAELSEISRRKNRK